MITSDDVAEVGDVVDVGEGARDEDVAASRHGERRRRRLRRRRRRRRGRGVPHLSPSLALSRALSRRNGESAA